MKNAPLIFVYLSMFAFCAVSIWYANYATEKGNQKFCDIINTVNSAYNDTSVPEPTTDLGKKLKQNYKDLKERLDC